MKTDFERAFIRAGRRGQALLQDELIALIPREYGGHVAQLGGAVSLVFDILMPGMSPSLAGEIALRVGEDASLFYLGHIGYHVDPPFPGGTPPPCAPAGCACPCFPNLGCGAL